MQTRVQGLEKLGIQLVLFLSWKNLVFGLVFMKNQQKGLSERCDARFVAIFGQAKVQIPNLVTLLSSVLPDVS